jgi:hypothetical protein
LSLNKFTTAILGCHFSTRLCVWEQYLNGRTDRETARATKRREKATTWRPRDSLFDFRVFVRVSKPDFPLIFCSCLKLFEHQTVRSSRIYCSCSATQ